MFELDRYHRECQKNNIPFIKARKNPQDSNYVVQLDMITCDYKLSKEGLDKIKKLLQKESNFLASEESTKHVFKGCNVDKELVWYDGILPHRLNNFCETLFDLATKFH